MGAKGVGESRTPLRCRLLREAVAGNRLPSSLSDVAVNFLSQSAEGPFRFWEQVAAPIAESLDGAGQAALNPRQFRPKVFAMRLEGVIYGLGRRRARPIPGSRRQSRRGGLEPGK